MKCLLFTKDHVWGHRAADIARHTFDTATIFAGNSQTPFPEAAQTAPCDIALSFLSPWIFPPAFLARAPLALNFHPGSRHYPGSGCYNFALYEEAAEFGAVCHHMLAKPDTGAIIAERRFAIHPQDSVESLQLKCFAHLLAMFVEICDRAQAGDRFADAAIRWERQPFTRKGMEGLKRLEPGMSADEVRKRTRASRYPGSVGVHYLEAGEMRLVEPIENRKAIAFD